MQKPTDLLEQTFWNLPKVELKLKPDDDFILEFKDKSFRYVNNIQINKTQHLNKYQMKRVSMFGKILQEIKSNFPEYPVYKIFKILRQKCGLDNAPKNEISNTKNETTLSKKSKRNRKKKFEDKSTEVIDKQVNLLDQMIWTEKYKPFNFEEILGNYSKVSELKKWLMLWKEYSDDVNISKRNRRDSESEFDHNDSNSCDLRLPSNAIILTGPPGCGKTMSVYAVCQELDIKVLELNVSSKRTGKLIKKNEKITCI